MKSANEQKQEIKRKRFVHLSNQFVGKCYKSLYLIYYKIKRFIYIQTRRSITIRLKINIASNKYEKAFIDFKSAY